VSCRIQISPDIHYYTACSTPLSPFTHVLAWIQRTSPALHFVSIVKPQDINPLSVSNS
jgi:hypothetical protein